MPCAICKIDKDLCQCQGLDICSVCNRSKNIPFRIFQLVFEQGASDFIDLGWTWDKNNWQLHTKVVERRIRTSNPTKIKMLVDQKTEGTKAGEVFLVQKVDCDLDINYEKSMKAPPWYINVSKLGKQFIIYDKDTGSTMTLSKDYPHSCPHCGSRAFISLNSVDCSNKCNK